MVFMVRDEECEELLDWAFRTIVMSYTFVGIYNNDDSSLWKSLSDIRKEVHGLVVEIAIVDGVYPRDKVFRSIIARSSEILNKKDIADDPV